MATELATHEQCPGNEALQGLLRARLSGADQERITRHLDECAGCRYRLELLASEGDEKFSDIVAHLDNDTPPKGSAYWDALNQAELSLTRSLVGDDTAEDHHEFNLSFLKPSLDPDFIGRIAHFEVRRLLGRGGMGAVLQARDPSLGRDVAIKILDPQLAGNKTARQRFCREARAAASVAHDNLVPVYQVDEDEDSDLPFIVMQLINGETLEQRLKRVGKLTVAQALLIGQQAAAGLAAAHAIGLIHRDIKPGNILLEGGTDKVKLTDFGLARAAEDIKLTRTGMVAGTPLYMAPEQARGEDIDLRSDLFSLGSVLYEALSGRPPFDGKTPLAVLRRIADDEHEPLEQVNPNVPDWLADVLDRLLAKNPNDRFQSAAEVAELFSTRYNCLPEVQAAMEPCPVSLSTSKLMGRRGRRRLAVAAGFALPFLVGALLGGAGIWFLKPGEQATPVDIANMLPTPGLTAAPAPKEQGPVEAITLGNNMAPVYSVASTADGKRAALGLENGDITLFDITLGRKITTLSKHAGPVWALDFIADGKQLISASDDSTLKVWNLHDNTVIRTIQHPSSVRSAAVNSDMTWVATGSRDGIVRIFDMDGDHPVRTFDHGAVVNAVAFAPDGLSVASAGTDHSVIVWDVPQEPNGLKRLTLKGHGGPVYGASFSPDGKWLATTGYDHSVILWDLDDGSIIRRISDAHSEGVSSVHFACCGKVIATAGQDGLAKIWDADTGKELARFSRHKGMVHTVRFTPDRSHLITGSQDGTARLWSIGSPPPHLVQK